MRFGSSVAAVRDEDPSLELNHRAVCQQEDNSDALPLRLLDIDTESVLAWLDASLSSPSMKMSPISYDAEDLALPEFVSTTPCQSVVSSAEVADVHTGVVDGTSDSIEVLASQDDRHEDHCVKNESGWSSTTSTKQPRVYTKARIEALKKEIDLLTLHLERERSSRECELYLRSSLELGTRKRYASLWKPIAMRQQKHREDAEKTNARLRELIHAQRRRVRQITRSLHLRTCHPYAEIAPSHPRCLSSPVSALQTSQIFAMLSTGLQTQYRFVDSQWASARIRELPSPGRLRLAPCQQGADAATITFINREAVPFDLPLVQQAVWTSLKNPRLRHPRCTKTEIISASDDRIQVVAIVPGESGGVPHKAKIRHASQCFVEASRVVFVSQSLTELSGAGIQMTPGTAFFATSIQVISRGQGSVDSISTTIETYLQICAYDMQTSTIRPLEQLEPFVSLSVAAVDDSLTRQHQAVEDLLVDFARVAIQC